MKKALTPEDITRLDTFNKYAEIIGNTAKVAFVAYCINHSLGKYPEGDKMLNAFIKRFKTVTQIAIEVR